MTPDSPAGESLAPPVRSQGLRQQLVKRFVVVFVIVTLYGSLFVLSAYRALQARAQRASADQMLANVRKGYEQLAAEWQQNGEELKTQIDFMRIFADGGGNRWLRLRAYFAALEGKGRRFESGLVLRADGSRAFQFGQETSSLADKQGRRSWYFSDAHGGAVYEPVSVPLWLGQDGLGTMLLLQAVDTAHLRLLAPPEASLYLVLDGKVITSSHGPSEVGMVMDAQYNGALALDGQDFEQRSFARFGNDADAPRIVLRARSSDALSNGIVLAAAVALLSALSVILWIVLGRWAQALTLRVATLSAANKRFALDHQMTPQMQLELQGAMARTDEISDVARASEDLMRSVVAYDEEHFAFMQTLNIMEEGVVEVDRQGGYLRASPGWSKLSGRNQGLEGRLFDSIHPDDVSALAGQFSHLFSGSKSNATGRLRLSRGDDAVDSWAEYRFVPSVAGVDGIVSVRGVLRDITQSYLLEKHISHMALHDSLTSLPNRVLLEDRITIAMRMADRSGKKVALGFIDLDHFKDINDHFGHTMGDQVLLRLAAALRKPLRSGDTLARWGGDEFVVLLTDVSDLQSAREVAAKLVTVCETPIEVDGTDFNVTFSMGVAVYPDDAGSTEALLSQADRAMFYVKHQGRNNVRFFADVLQKEDKRRSHYIQNRLAAAIKARQIQAWFQPIVAADGHTVVGCEALARWHDESYGWVSPATFIPMAENLGLISELGMQVWSEAINGLQRWRAMGLDLHMAVNISRRQLFTPSFTAELLQDLEKLAIPTLCVDLEITESVAMEDAQHTSKRLAELVAAGFNIAIDDFGTGYSSLSQLHTMPAAKLKIDISFVRRIHEPQGAKLVGAIVQMAQAFQMQTVAEGVEDELTAQVLLGMGVTFLQGYHFGKPMPALDFERRCFDRSGASV